jgi:hypothetical protein
MVLGDIMNVLVEASLKDVSLAVMYVALIVFVGIGHDIYCALVFDAEALVAESDEYAEILTPSRSKRYAENILFSILSFCLMKVTFELLRSERRSDWVSNQRLRSFSVTMVFLVESLLIMEFLISLRDD